MSTLICEEYSSIAPIKVGASQVTLENNLEAVDSLKATNAIISDSFTCKPLANSFIFLGTNAGVVVSPKGIPISVKQSTSLESAARPLLICIENIAADIGFSASNSGLSISF